MYFYLLTLLLLLFYAMIYKLQLVFLKIMWVFPNMDTAEISSFCWSQSAGLQKHLFYMTSSQGRSSVPSSMLLCVNIRKLSWIPLFHARACCTPSFWVTETICIEKCQHNQSNLTNQRVYQELVYRNKPFKKMITGSATLPLPSFLPFYFHVHVFSTRRPDYLRAWNRLLLSRPVLNKLS